MKKVSIGWIKWDTHKDKLALKGVGKYIRYSRTPKHIIYRHKKVAENNCREDEVVLECFVEYK